MKKIFMLEHKREIDDVVILSSLIGFYTSKDIVDHTVNKYRMLEGYRDYPDDFLITEYEIAENVMQAFVVFHEYSDEEFDYPTLIGVFSTEEDAIKAQMVAIKEQPFAQYPDGFTIDNYELNKDFWTEGFFIYE